MKPKMSVITTVYNAEKYIAASINSILGQSFGDFEFIIINDGSTDGTADTIRRYRDPRIRYVHDSLNRKIPSRRNQAIEMARTNIVVIHDGDDISLPDRLDESYRVMFNHQEIFCVGGHATKIDLDGNEIGEMDYPPETFEECKRMVRYKCMNPMIDPTTSFRKDIFQKLGCYTPEQAIYTVPDFDLWLKAMSKGHQLVNLQAPFIKYRENPDGMTGRKKDEMIKAHMIVWSRYMKQLRNAEGSEENRNKAESKG